MLTKSDLVAIERLLDPKFKEINGEFKKIGGEFEKVNGEFRKVNGEFKKIDSKFGEVSNGFLKLNRKIDQIERANQRRHEELQASINVMADSAYKDIDDLKRRAVRVERHLGFAVAQ